MGELGVDAKRGEGMYFFICGVFVFWCGAGVCSGSGTECVLVRDRKYSGGRQNVFCCASDFFLGCWEKWTLEETV